MKFVFLLFFIRQAILSHGAPDPKTIIEFDNYDGPVYIHTTPNSPADECYFKNTPKTPLMFNQEPDCACKTSNSSPEPIKTIDILKNLFNTASQASCNNNPMGKNSLKDIKSFTGRNNFMGKTGTTCNSNLATYQHTDVDYLTGVNNPASINTPTGINSSTGINISTSINNPTGENCPKGVNNPSGINNPMGTNYPQTGVCYRETVFVPKSLSYSKVVNSAGDTISMTYDNLHGCKCNCAKQY